MPCHPKPVTSNAMVGPPAGILEHNVVIKLSNVYMGTLAVDVHLFSTKWCGGGNHEINPTNVANIASALQVGVR